jgi:cystathionine beta-lyase/cystathionine gamma-synthase
MKVWGIHHTSWPQRRPASPFKVDPALIRLSDGLEHVDDLSADLQQTLVAQLAESDNERGQRFTLASFVVC